MIIIQKAETKNIGAEILRVVHTLQLAANVVGVVHCLEEAVASEVVQVLSNNLTQFIVLQFRNENLAFVIVVLICQHGSPCVVVGESVADDNFIRGIRGSVR